LYFIDANIFLELELGQANARDCKAFLTKVSNGQSEALTSDFVVDTVCIVMEREGVTSDKIRIFLVSLVLYKGLHIHTMSMLDKVETTLRMVETGLDFDDATAVQCMHRNNISDIVSYDPHFDGKRGIRRLAPEQANRRI